MIPSKYKYIRIFTICSWIVLYLFSFELFINIGDSLNSDLIYIESLYRDFFTRNYEINGWLVSKAPYYFPDWILYAAIRFFSGNYVTAWYLYVFCNFALLLIFFYYFLKIFYSKKDGDLLFYTLAWGAGLIVLLASAPSGYGPHTFLFPVYHSGAILNGLVLLLVWLISIKRELSKLQLTIFAVFVALATMSDLWLVIWFVIPIIMTTAILIFFKRLNLQKNLATLAYLLIGVFFGGIANPLLEKFGYLYFPHDQLGAPQSLYIEQLTHIFRDLGSLLFNSPLLLLFFIISLYFAIVSIFPVLNNKNIIRKTTVKIDNENIVPNLAIHIFVLFSYITPIILIVAFKMWGGWNYRYLHNFIIFPWLITGFYVFNFVKCYSRNKIINIFYILCPLVLLTYLFTDSHNSSFAPTRRGVPLAWLNPAYPQEIACVDNVARSYNLKAGISEYWVAKKITEVNKANLLVNQFTYNLDVHHWMNNTQWFLDKFKEKKDYIKYDFIVTETVGNQELKKNVEILFGKPSAQIQCGLWDILIYKDEKRERLNNVIRYKLNQFFNLDILVPNDSIKFLKTPSPNYKILDDWHYFPGNANLSFVSSMAEKGNNFSNLNQYLRFRIEDEINFALLEKHVKIQDIAAKNLDITFWGRAPFGRVEISSMGYLAPQGRLDESAKMFLPSKGGTYVLDDKWKMIRLNFSVPPSEKNKLSKDAYALIRPVFIGNKVSNITLDITDFRINAYDSSRGYPTLSQDDSSDSLFNMAPKYIAESDYFSSKNRPYEEFRAIRSIDTTSADTSEVLWRLSRVHMRLSEIGKTREEREISVIAAATYAWRAINKSVDVNTLKWRGITAAELGKIEGHKQYLAGSKIMFDNLIQAIDIAPTDADLYYLLGKWNIEWASSDIFWPSKLNGSYESALKQFQQAVKFDPKNVMYRLWLAYTLLKLNKVKESNIIYQSAADIGIKTDAEISISNKILSNIK
jgi:tetratricopeptide (TPR) repeat protein